MDKVNTQIRLYGTSNIQYDLIFKSRESIKQKILPNFSKDDKLELPRYLFHPEQKFILYWTVFGMLFLIYTISFMPYGMLYYDSNKEVQIFETVMNFYFLTDILIIFNTAYWEDSACTK